MENEVWKAKMEERTLSQAIREERTKRGLSQRQVANSIGVSATLISWAETGNQPVSREVLRQILQTLELNPNDFQELGEENEIQAPQQRENRSARRPRPKPDEPGDQDETMTGKEKPPELPDNEKEEILLGEIERFMRIWSRMSDLHQHEDGKWHIPEGDTKGPEEICQEATRRGFCDQETHPKGPHLVELQEGLVQIQAAKDEPGHVLLELLHEPMGDDAPAWRFDSDRPEAATVQFVPVLRPEQRSPGDNREILSPGLYRLRAEADTPWQFQWAQHAPSTGWIDLLEDPRVQREGEFNPGGLNWIGPTAPNWTAVEVMVQQEEKARMEVWAHPVDGGKETLLVQQDVGTEPARLPADLDPEQEYIIVVMTEARWDLWFVGNQERANKSDGD